MIIDVDGQKFDVPDDATPDEIDGLTRPKFQGATARSGAEWAMQGMSPLERKLAAFGENAAHTLKQGGNLIGNIAEGLTGKRLGMPTDAEVEESAALNAPLNEAHPGYALAGQIAPQMLPVGGGGAAVARAGLGSRLANVGTQAALGAAQGYTFSDPSQRGTNAALGGLVGGGVAAVANPLAAVARRALDRADEGAYKLFEPTIEKLRELAEKGRKAGQTAEQGMRNFGRQIRETIDPGTGRRLIDPVAEVGERELAVGRVGAQGGRQINRALGEMDDMGLVGRPAEVRRQLIQARDELLGTGDVATFTPTQRRSLMTINRQIDDFDRVFGTKVNQGPVNPGAIPEESVPLTMHPERAERAAVSGVEGVPVIAESQVGAAAPETLRVFDPPAIKGKIGRYDPVKKKMVSDVPAQPHLQASREVEIPNDAWSPWRSFVERNRARAVEGRPQPMSRNQYVPREVTREGVPGVGSPMQMVEFNDLPLSEFESKAKRLLGKEGFQKSGSGRYRTAEAADSDPAIQWLRRATGILKGHTEAQFSPRYFMEGKKMAALDEILGPAAKDAAVTKAGRTVGTGGSPQGFLFRRAIDAAKRHTRPYGIKANESIDAIANALPHNLDADVRKALIAALRQETSNAP